MTFENGRTEQELVSLAKEQGIKVYGLSDYCIEEGRKEGATILLGYANLSEEEIRDAAEVLNRVWR